MIDASLTPAQQRVLLVLGTHKICSLARTTHDTARLVGSAASYRLQIKGLVTIDFWHGDVALTPAGKRVVEQIRGWRNARPVDVQALASCTASSGGPACGRCHSCGAKLRTVNALSCQRCGSSDADE